MKIRSFRTAYLSLLVTGGCLAFTSCTVDQNAAMTREAAETGSGAEEEETEAISLVERMREAREERRRNAVEEAEPEENEESPETSGTSLRERLAERREERQERREAWLAAKRKAEQEREERRAASREVEAVAERSGGGGFFSRLAISTPGKYESDGHAVKVDQRLLGAVNSSNSRIEIDLSEQRARVYRRGSDSPVIETQISSGKPGYSTPTGTYHIREKLVHKRSTLYGRWVDSSGATVRSDGDSRYRPAGGSRFIGAEMPYWMRVTGGIGMHIGYVADYPASHGCIRVPEAVQPLIYSKVGVGTPVTIRH